MENIDSQREFLSKLLELIPDMESNGSAISSVISAYSDMETYDILSKNVILTSQDGLKITFDISTYITYLRESIESLEIRMTRRKQ